MAMDLRSEADMLVHLMRNLQLEILEQMRQPSPNMYLVAEFRIEMQRLEARLEANRQEHHLELAKEKAQAEVEKAQADVEKEKVHLQVELARLEFERLRVGHPVPVARALTFKVRHWSSMFDEQYVQCDARALFDTVRAQFKLGPEEDFAIYYFPPGPPRSSDATGIVRIKLSLDRLDEIERIGCLVNRPFLYLHSCIDNIDILAPEALSSSSAMPCRASPLQNLLPKGSVYTPSRGVLSPQPVDLSPSPPLSDDVLSNRHVSQTLKNRVAHKNNWTCYVCLEILPPTFEIDHITPSINGLYNNDEANLQALCPNCHRLKTASEFHQMKSGAARAVVCDCSSKSKCKTGRCACLEAGQQCSAKCLCSVDVCERRL